jgi:D-alanine-D-alanine ligase-like ATP-grasp enzyme
MIGNGDQMILMPCEIVFKAPKALRVITTRDKDKHHTQAIPVDDLELCEELWEMAIQAFRVAGVRDYSRFDVIYAGGKFYAIEINGQPMVPDMWFEACARGVGLD